MEIQYARGTGRRYNPPRFDPTADSNLIADSNVIGTFEAFITPNTTYRTLFCMFHEDCAQLLSRTYDGADIVVAIDGQYVTPVPATFDLITILSYILSRKVTAGMEAKV